MSTIVAENICERKSISPDLAANIPDALRDVPHWCVWRWKAMCEANGEPAYDVAGVRKRTKVPYHGETLRKIDATDLSNGVALETSLETFRVWGNDRGATRVAGVGFLLGGGFAGVDLDKVLEPDTRAVKVQWADDAINSLDTYTEVSPSGTGVKMIMRATTADVMSRGDHKFLHKLPFEDKSALEIYTQDRFFTFTGDRLQGTPVQVGDRGAELADLYYRHFGEKIATAKKRRESRAECPPGTARAPGTDAVVPDDVCLARIRSSPSGEKFDDLFLRGDLTDSRGDHSAADLALCNYLAYWTGLDPEWMDDLFRQSALYRDKWDRMDYKDRTINNAIDSRDDFFDWEQNKRSENHDESMALLIAEQGGYEPRIGTVYHPDAYRATPPAEPRTEPRTPSEVVPPYVPRVPVQANPFVVTLQGWAEVCDIADNQHEDWIIPKWLEFGCLHLFTGLPFAGKSTIVGQFIAAMAQRTNLFGLEVNPVPFVLLDLENKERILVKRLRACLGDDPGDISKLFHRVPPKEIKLPLEGSFIKSCLRELHELIGATAEKGVIIIDTFRSAFAGHEDYDEISPGGMISILKPLKDLAAETNWAILVLHHNAKASNAYSGTTAIAGVADYLWNWKVDKDKLEGQLSLEGRDDYVKPLLLKYDVEKQQNVLVGNVPDLKKEKEDHTKSTQDDIVTCRLLRNLTAADASHDLWKGVEAIGTSAGQSAQWATNNLNKQLRENRVTRIGEGKRGSPFLYAVTVEGQNFLFSHNVRLDSD